MSMKRECSNQNGTCHHGEEVHRSPGDGCRGGGRAGHCGSRDSAIRRTGGDGKARATFTDAVDIKIKLRDEGEVIHVRHARRRSCSGSFSARRSYRLAQPPRSGDRPRKEW